MFVTVLLLLCPFNSVKAEINPTVDSLTRLLNSSKSDKDKINLLNRLSKELMDIDYHKALQYWNESLELSEKLKDTVNMMEAHFHIGQINVNYSLNYKNGIEHLLEALMLVKKTDRRKSEMSILSLIGYVNNRQGNFSKAIEYYKNAIAIAKKYNYESDYTYYNSYIADLFEGNGLIDSAIVYYGKIYEIEEEHHFMHTRPVAMFAIGKYFQLKDEYKEALRYYTEALIKFQKEDNHRWESYTYNVISDLMLKNKEYETALETANKGLALAEKYHLVKEIADNHNSLSNIYFAKGNYELAFKHYKLHDAINDSIFSIDQIKEISNIQNDYELIFKKQELELLVQEKAYNELKLKQNRIILFCISAVGLVLIILSVVLWRRYAQKKKINDLLRGRDELRELKMEDVVNRLNKEAMQHKLTQLQLVTTNEELNNFMYRSSHDLRSPMISIIALTKIALETKSKEERNEVLKMIQLSTEKLHKLLDEMLEATRVTHGNIKISAFVFHEFVEEMLQEIESENVNIKLVADKNFICRTDRNLLRAILQNIIDNSIKYRNTQISNPSTRIQGELVDGKIVITVSDNGQGIAKEQQTKVFDMFVRSNTESKGSGLGLYIVKKSIEKLSGTISMESELGVGTTFTIMVPNLVLENK